MSTQTINLDDFSTIGSIFDKQDTNNEFTSKVNNEDNEDLEIEPNISVEDPSLVDAISETKEVINTPFIAVNKSTGDVLEPITWTNMFNHYKNIK
jgi:hypothetical protein